MGGADGWVNSLSDFTLNQYVDVIENLRLPLRLKILAGIHYIGKRTSGKILKNGRKIWEDKFQRFLNHGGIYAMRQSALVNVFPSKEKTIYCRGRFEAHDYFDSLREQLLDDFTPIHAPLAHNKNLYKQILNTESVCITIRRGDFLDKGNEAFNVCTPDYFYQAMKNIKEEIPECKFFVFSDAIEEIKQIMNFPYEVEYEWGNDPVWEKLRLMYSCRHFIISNSTFSWWAQYLSRNDNKIVYAPQKWRLGDEDCSGMYLDYMRFVE